MRFLWGWRRDRDDSVLPQECAALFRLVLDRKQHKKACERGCGTRAVTTDWFGGRVQSSPSTLYLSEGKALDRDLLLEDLSV